MKKVILTAALAIAALTGLKAQQEAMFSQYMFNQVFLNPAYAGTQSYISSTLLYRDQWTNWEGAPKTAVLSVDGPIANNTMGWGLSICNDKIGVNNNTDIYANYAYKIKFSEKTRLSFGIRAGGTFINAQSPEIYWDGQNGGDPNMQPFRAFATRIGFGMFFNTERFYAGLSFPTLMAYVPKTKFNIDFTKTSFLRRHYFLQAGYVIKANDFLKIRPSFLMKYQTATVAPVQFDFNLHFLFNDKVWVGASYRTQDAVVGMIEFLINRRFRIGYAYDYKLQSVRYNYVGASHEFMLGFDFGRGLLKIKTPRYF
jgi:type IX secretion system PorP/SprF family membrane protein